MSKMFYNCISFEKLSDINKWNISGTQDFYFIFNNCIHLSDFPRLENCKNINNSLIELYFYNYWKIDEILIKYNIKYESDIN